MKERKSNIELLRILCIIFIISDHFTGQSGIATYDTTQHLIIYTISTCGSRIACAIFVIISAWFGVEQKFNFCKVIKIWISTFFYVICVTLMCALFFHIPYDEKTIIRAFFPISGGALWFVSYFMILMLISPFLNLIVNRLERNEYKLALILASIPIIMFLTVFNMVTNPLSNEMWGFIYIWFLTGYFKRFQPKWITNKWLNFSFMLFGQLIICFIRALAQQNDNVTIAAYMEMYRAMFWTLPPLIIAFCSFFFFNSIDIGSSKIINKMASTTLGIYVIHQTPGFYPYLWNGIFKTSQYVGTKWQVEYGIFVVFTVFIGCMMIDIVRQKLFQKTIEKTKIYQYVCTSGNKLYENMINQISK